MLRKVTPSELASLTSQVEKYQLHPRGPVDSLFNEIQDSVDIAEIAGVPISIEQQINKRYVIL